MNDIGCTRQLHHLLTNILIWLNNHFKISTVIVIHFFLKHGLENISVSEIIFLNGSDG